MNNHIEQHKNIVLNWLRTENRISLTEDGEYKFWVGDGFISVRDLEVVVNHLHRLNKEMELRNGSLGS